jgi:4-amino-4-deoxy-L-arabinose transferase-like glycosyltransferase
MGVSPPSAERFGVAETSARAGPNPFATGSPFRILQIALAFVIAVVLLGQGIKASFIKDAEPQSAQWIADVVNHGNWLLPRDYYGLVDPKPPLFYWLSAIVVKVTGGKIDEVRARAVSLVAGAALAAEVMAWTAARLGTSGGWLAFAFLLGTYGFAARATVALTDMLLTFLLFSTYLVMMPQLAAASAIFPADSRGREASASASPNRGPGKDAVSGWPWRTMNAGLLLGLAILTKGPLALALLGLAIVIYLLSVHANPLSLLGRAWPWGMLAISLAIACLWYLPAFVVGRGADFGKVFFHENLGHFLPASAGGTGEAARPVYYIALRIVGGSFPLSLLIPAVAISCREYAVTPRRDLLYQLSMALAVIVMFSLASAKRDDYILPAFPSLAILLAAQFIRNDDAERRTGRLVTFVRDAAVAGPAVAILLALIATLLLKGDGGSRLLDLSLTSSDKSYAAIVLSGVTHLKPAFLCLGSLAVLGAMASLAGVCYKRPSISGAGFGLLCLAGSTLWIGTVKPIEASTRNIAGFAASVRAETGNAQVYAARPDPEMAWYYGRGMPVIPRVIAVSGPPPGREIYFVARPHDLALLAPSVREHMTLTIQSKVQGAGGPPALYLLGSSQDPARALKLGPGMKR